MASEDFLSQGIIYGRGEDDSTYSCALWPTSGIRGLDRSIEPDLVVLSLDNGFFYCGL